MKKMFQKLSLATVIALSSSAAHAVAVGKSAPAFELKDQTGKSHKLSDFKGKHVVLEWLNPGCPFVEKHYESGNMQKLQKDTTAKGVVWLAINSSAEGKEGHLNAKDAQEFITTQKAAPTALLMDPQGTVGKAFDAKVTPHMYIIDPKGVVVYNGAIDDKATTKVEDVKTAKNFVTAALDESLAGKAVTVSSNRPYGCSVKYLSN